MSTQKCPILIVEDHELPAKWLIRTFDALDPERLLHLARDVVEAFVLLAEGIDFGGAVLDYYLPFGTGLDILARIRERNRRIPVLVLTSSNDRSVINGAQALGAFLANKPPSELTIRRVLESVVDYQRELRRTARLESAVFGGLPGALLTPRQREVLRVRLCSRTNEDAAAQLGIELCTVKSHMRAIRCRFGVDDFASLVATVMSGILADGRESQ